MVNRSGSTKRRLNETQHRQSKAHKMGMQISRGIHPKYRKKSIYGWVRKELGPIIRDLAQQKESVVEEGHLMADHVHMLLSIPPKYSVSGVVGFIKGKSAIAIARNFMDRAKNFVGQNFWARGYYVSTVGRDEAQIREYIREQEKEDKRLEQLKIFE
jgi:putative transposase